MNIKKLTDSIKKDGTIVFHSTRTAKELSNIILTKEFKAGNVGGAMLGPGFYANQHLYQAKKGNYGRYILKSKLYGIRKFLILDKEIYEELFGPASDSFVLDQMVAAGFDKDEVQQIIIQNLSSKTSELAYDFYQSFGRKLMSKFGGIEYTGSFDRESVVCWYPAKQIAPLEMSYDGGETWNHIDTAEDIAKHTLELNAPNSKDMNLKSAEAVRSVQRARDLILRYEKYPDDKLAGAINSQLKRISSVSKKEQRRDAFISQLNELRPSVVSLLE